MKNLSGSEADNNTDAESTYVMKREEDSLWNGFGESREGRRLLQTANNLRGVGMVQWIEQCRTRATFKTRITEDHLSFGTRVNLFSWQQLVWRLKKA